ncbi:MAG: malto-oligosyltrehalose trehalohydrolase [Burkholderiales bacterium]|nr:malto-oligosyltrehalose trehalohydrolase [Burkholderiales bacterium]
MPFGAEPLPGGGVRFRLWAPGAASVTLQLGGAGDAQAASLPMQRMSGEVLLHGFARDASSAVSARSVAEGWFECIVPEAGAGTDYRYLVRRSGAELVTVPDPASRFNPWDVHGASRVVDASAYRWRNAGWRGRPWHEAVIYELHVGAFTPAGTFEAVIQRLPELAALGITAIELMPVAAFVGARGWGYDGVLPFAPHAAYGTPEALKRLVDEAHGLGLMMLLDVVYNHFGPDGNYLHAYCPPFFDAAKATPWGPAINFDGLGSEAVRAFFVHNALYWVEEYRLDGLRLDAVHAIDDDSPQHIVAEIAQALRDGPGRERAVHLVLENDQNQANLLARNDDGALCTAVAQWNDDFHHAAHVLATGESDGYYAAFADEPAAKLALALAEGFVFQGRPGELRHGRVHGEPSAHLPASAFVAFLQNHDQIGNRAFGERLHALAAAPRLEALTACLLLSPHVPLLFMGEEFAAGTPFLYFCDFETELAAAVTSGRRREFARFAAFRGEAARARIPDPNALATFEASRLRWEECAEPAHAQRRALVGELLRLRHRHLTPRLAGLSGASAAHRCEDGLLQVRWRLGDGSSWRLCANFGDAPKQVAATGGEGTVVYASRAVRAADAWLLPTDAVLVSLHDDHGRH